MSTGIKILLLSDSDSIGGAAVAANKLASALHTADYKVTLGVLEKKSDLFFVKELSFKRNFFQKIRKKVLSYTEAFLYAHFKTSNGILHSFNLYSKINIEDINKSDYDIVHLHWINNNMISVRDIAGITKPVVWTLHDSWAFCGAEHHPNILEKDERFITGYTAKNKPHSTTGFDICKIVYCLKKQYLQTAPLYFIAPSRWEYDCLKKSTLFRNHACSIIPNIIDKDIFYPAADKQYVKKLFNIPVDKKILGFGAAYNINDLKSIKGGYYLRETLKKIKNSEDYHLVIFGPASQTFTAEVKIPAFYTGYIASPVILSAIYNCCDVFVCPSVIENLPYTCLEAACCGVPVAAFNTGGIPDIIEHKYNGYLAEPFEAEDLYRGILYIFDNLTELSKNCIKKTEKDFNPLDIVRKHIELYEKLITLHNKDLSKGTIDV